MSKLKELYKKILIFYETNTSGVPFLLWGIAGLSIIAFVFVFRNEPFIESSKLLPLLPIASIWFIGSDYLKAKKKFNPKIHFFFDSLFYVAFFSGIFHFTGEMDGRLFFITLVPAMSAPFFSTFLSSFIFALFLYSSITAVYFLDGTSVTNYNTGIIILQSLIGLTIITMIGYFFNSIKTLKNERAEFAEKEVTEKTTELRKTMEILDKNRIASKRKYEELEKFQKLVINREIKMIELKERIVELEEKLSEKNKT